MGTWSSATIRAGGWRPRTRQGAQYDLAAILDQQPVRVCGGGQGHRELAKLGNVCRARSPAQSSVGRLAHERRRYHREQQDEDKRARNCFQQPIVHLAETAPVNGLGPCAQVRRQSRAELQRLLAAEKT